MAHLPEVGLVPLGRVTAKRVRASAAPTAIFQMPSRCQVPSCSAWPKETCLPGPGLLLLLLQPLARGTALEEGLLDNH